MFKFNMLDEVKDVVTGLVGKVTQRIENFTGGNSYFISPKTKDNNTWENGGTFDEDRLALTSDIDKAAESEAAA